MRIDSVAVLIEAIRKQRLVDSAVLDNLLHHQQGKLRDPQVLGRQLIQRGLLTPYQVNQLLQGNGRDLTLGSYVLLERLGEGGMGQVFKARHAKLGRTVALKQMRKELMADLAAVRRFHREIQVAAALSHPNIVLAYDADEIDGIHFYTMEYVEGTILGHLVQRSGPLFASLACEYIRQAACGLAHAYEKGLVHRDIKPTNLIQTWTSAPSNPTAGPTAERHDRALWGSNLPLIKIFDMGLARPILSDERPVHDGSITMKGALMGTPDFISPEQALNAESADIRSDLYSLGATFYCLVAGQVPFPGGTMLEKVIHHREDQPKPIRTIRPNVPAEVEAIIAKLMAKQPEQRYQTPAELVKVLTDFLEQSEKKSLWAEPPKRKR